MRGRSPWRSNHWSSRLRTPACWVGSSTGTLPIERGKSARAASANSGGPYQISGGRPSLWLSGGNSALLMVLAASASYIAVPAVLRHAIPEARPWLYFGMSLGLTFPFNILLGIPLYTGMAQRMLG